MPHNTAFHLGLHCLPKYLFAVVQHEKGYNSNKFGLFVLMLFVPINSLLVMSGMNQYYSSEDKGSCSII